MAEHADRPCLRVGGYYVRYDVASGWVARYVDPGNAGSAYWAYDTYRDRARYAPLDDADLLSPVLLSSPLPLQAYAWLRMQLPALNDALAAIPDEASLADEHSEPALLRPLFAVFDEGHHQGERDHERVGPTILAKVLHRKRPGFIPVLDHWVRACYVTAPGAPVPDVSDRRYGDWIQALGAAFRSDLRADPVAWKELASLASATGPGLTELRALDIVAWQLGQSPKRACSQHE